VIVEGKPLHYQTMEIDNDPTTMELKDTAEASHNTAETTKMATTNDNPKDTTQNHEEKTETALPSSKVQPSQGHSSLS